MKQAQTGSRANLGSTYNDFDLLTRPGSAPIEPAVKPEILTIADVMQLYKVSRSTVYRRIKDGTLTTYKLGSRTIRFDAAEVAAAFRKAAQ